MSIAPACSVRHPKSSFVRFPGVAASDSLANTLTIDVRVFSMPLATVFRAKSLFIHRSLSLSILNLLPLPRSPGSRRSPRNRRSLPAPAREALSLGLSRPQRSSQPPSLLWGVPASPSLLLAAWLDRRLPVLSTETWEVHSTAFGGSFR